jgi:hypothetical protein
MSLSDPHSSLMTLVVPREEDSPMLHASRGMGILLYILPGQHAYKRVYPASTHDLTSTATSTVVLCTLRGGVLSPSPTSPKHARRSISSFSSSQIYPTIASQKRPTQSDSRAHRKYPQRVAGNILHTRHAAYVGDEAAGSSVEGDGGARVKVGKEICDLVVVQ